MRARSLVVALCLALSVGPLNPTSSAADPLTWPVDWLRYWQNTSGTTPQYYGFEVKDDFTDGAEGRSFISVPMPGNQPYCNGVDDEFCAEKAKSFGWWGNVMLSPCSIVKEESPYCVASLKVERDGEVRTSSLIRELSTPSWAKDPQGRLPYPGSRSIWSDPFSTDSNAGYLISVGGGLANNGTNAAPRFSLGGIFNATIGHYLQEERPGLRGLTLNGTQNFGGVPVASFSGQFNSDECLWIQDGLCGKRQQIATEDRLTLELRMPKSLTGWLGGRLEEPSVSVKSASTFNTLTVSAKPAVVGRIAGIVEAKAATPAIAEVIQKRYTFLPGINTPVIGGRNARAALFEEFRLFTPYLNDTLAGTETVWNVGRFIMETGNLGCLMDTQNLVGLVTTNAPIFQAGPPEFNKEEQSFNYQVAGLHWKPDKTQFLGTYDLLIRSDAARCQYQFSSAPIKATISVVSSNGEQTAAVTTFKEENGWTYFSARGFGFSEPQIKIKLTQTTVRKTTITCVKGKASKKVSGVKPQCPRGWKQRK